MSKLESLNLFSQYKEKYKPIFHLGFVSIKILEITLYCWPFFSLVMLLVVIFGQKVVKKVIKSSKILKWIISRHPVEAIWFLCVRQVFFLLSKY